MKWLVFAGLLVCLARFGEGGALKCVPGSQDAACRTQKTEEKEVSLQQETEPECLAGSEWESNCHYCRCSDSGVAECLKQDTCGDGIITEPIRCKPNTTFERDCNTCVCLENGLGLCTMNYCWKSSNDYMKCAPGTSWTNQCNSCECSIMGQGICTEAVCPQDSGPLRYCAPKSEWKNDCFSCWCTEEGMPMCTRTGCIGTANLNFDDRLKESSLEKVPEAKNGLNDEDNHRRATKEIESINTNKTLHKISKRDVCKPNQEFKMECNVCKCSSNGGTYTCSHEECLDKDTEKDVDKEVEVFMENEGVDHIERHSVCKPRDTFYVGCNTCHCNNDGTDYSCTNKPCPLPDDVELFHELKETKPIVPYTDENGEEEKHIRYRQPEKL